MATQREQADQPTGKSGTNRASSGATDEGSRSSAKSGGSAARSASRGAKGGAQSASSEQAELEQEDSESEADDLDGVETVVSMLVGMAQMDNEAAFAYQTAAELVDVPDVRAQLLAFAGDHRRHVADIGRAIEQLGGEPAAAAPPPETSVFALLTSALGMVGPRAVLLALIGNEEFTNSAYDTALELVPDPELHALLERNFEDEQRHITWLATQARPTDEDEPLATAEN
jgi:rubrerythrin